MKLNSLQVLQTDHKSSLVRNLHFKLEILTFNAFRGEAFSVNLGSFEEAVSINTSIPEEAIQTAVDTQVKTCHSVHHCVPPNLISNTSTRN